MAHIKFSADHIYKYHHEPQESLCCRDGLMFFAHGIDDRYEYLKIAHEAAIKEIVNLEVYANEFLPYYRQSLDLLCFRDRVKKELDEMDNIIIEYPDKCPHHYPYPGRLRKTIGRRYPYWAHKNFTYYGKRTR